MLPASQFRRHLSRPIRPNPLIHWWIEAEVKSATSQSWSDVIALAEGLAGAMGVRVSPALAIWRSQALLACAARRGGFVVPCT
jgi:hypothetical protein